MGPRGAPKLELQARIWFLNMLAQQHLGGGEQYRGDRGTHRHRTSLNLGWRDNLVKILCKQDLSSIQGVQRHGAQFFFRVGGARRTGEGVILVPHSCHMEALKGLVQLQYCLRRHSVCTVREEP